LSFFVPDFYLMDPLTSTKPEPLLHAALSFALELPKISHFFPYNHRDECEIERAEIKSGNHRPLPQQLS
jgi:hypothetical protein